MKKYNKILATLAFTLVMAGSVQGARAYFTTYAQAQGGYSIQLGEKTTVTEEFSDWTKHVSIMSREDSQPVYIRARAFSGTDGDGNANLSYSGQGWTENPEDGWWYYGEILNGGETAQELLVKIGNIPEDPKAGDQFHVIVVYECTPVLYNDEGIPYADWTLKITDSQAELSAEAEDSQETSAPAGDGEVTADE